MYGQGIATAMEMSRSIGTQGESGILALLMQLPVVFCYMSAPIFILLLYIAVAIHRSSRIGVRGG